MITKICLKAGRENQTNLIFNKSENEKVGADFGLSRRCTILKPTLRDFSLLVLTENHQKFLSSQKFPELTHRYYVILDSILNKLSRIPEP